MMNNSLKKLLSMILCVVLVAAMALFATGCMENGKEEATGESVSFTVIVVDLEGKETTYEITTTETTVGAALMAEELLAGEDGPYGLYIKEVAGIPLDWDIDGKYWAVYVDGEYALSGVDSLAVTEGAEYTFKPE